MSSTAALLFALGMAAAQTLPSGPLVVRGFTLRFEPAGTFTLSGEGWPPMAGTWTTSGNEVTLHNTTGPKDCMNPARYAFTVDGARVGLSAVADDCKVRQMILNGSQWLPAGTSPAAAARRIVHTPGPVKGALPAANGSGTGRRSADVKRPAWRIRRTCLSAGIRRPAKTFCGRRRFPGCRTRVRSCGAM